MLLLLIFLHSFWAVPAMEAPAHFQPAQAFLLDTVPDQFDVEAVFSACTPLYLPINVHFFTSDDCQGKVYLRDQGTADEYADQYEAFDLADQLVTEANFKFAHNERQWQSDIPSGHCVPLRYVLSGVFIHCKTADQQSGGGLSSKLQRAYAVNPDTELNLYISEFAGSATGQAFSGGAYLNIDWAIPGNMNHEVGHVFNLWHAWEQNDGCPDTPPLMYSWDKNCNGKLEPSEIRRQCWSHIDLNNFADDNKNGVHDCRETEPCTPSPCCDWGFVNNNVMGYNAYQSALTDCQIRRMLKDLATTHRNYFSFAPCPPASAFIAQAPIDTADHSRPLGCLMLSASFNDAVYLFAIYKVENGEEIPVYTPGWQNGPAKSYCFSTGEPTEQGNYLKPNTVYRARLKVKNTCGESDAVVYDFTTRF